MKYLPLLVLLAAAIGCRKNGSEKPAPFQWPMDGTATALKNGVPWAAKVSCGYFFDSLNNYTIRIATFDGNGYIADYIGLGQLPFQASLHDTLKSVIDDSTHSIKTKLVQGSYTRNFGSDVTSGPWNLDLALPHRISVTYDSANQMVSGTFEAGFWIGLDTVYSPWAKPVHFTNGSFKAKMHHYQPPPDE